MAYSCLPITRVHSLTFKLLIFLVLILLESHNKIVHHTGWVIVTDSGCSGDSGGAIVFVHVVWIIVIVMFIIVWVDYGWTWDDLSPRSWFEIFQFGDGPDTRSSIAGWNKQIFDVSLLYRWTSVWNDLFARIFTSDFYQSIVKGNLNPLGGPLYKKMSKWGYSRSL